MTTSIQAAGSSITCTSIQLDWGFGPFMEDSVTGQQGGGLAYGGIQDLELTMANQSSTYVIPHMLACALDPSQVNNDFVYPTEVANISTSNSGPLSQGMTFGIPASVAMPAGLNRGEQLLWNVAQQFGLYNYTVKVSGAISIFCNSILSENAALVQQIVNGFSTIVAELCILSNQVGASTAKGMLNGQRSDAFSPPALLSLASIGGYEVSSETVGAYFPSTLAPYGVGTGGFTAPAPTPAPTPSGIGVTSEPTATPNPTPTPTMTVSPNDIIVTPTSGGDLVDSAGIIYTMSNAGSGTIFANGAPITQSGGTVEITIVNGVIWAEQAPSGPWFTLINGTFTVQESTPPGLFPSPTPTLTPSPTDTVLTSTTGHIVDSNGNVWMLIQGTTGLEIVVNGSLAPTPTTDATLLLYFGGNIYYALTESSSQVWWSYNPTFNTFSLISGDPRATPTPTPTATATATATPTPTPTATATPTPTPTPTPNLGITFPTLTLAVSNVESTSATLSWNLSLNGSTLALLVEVNQIFPNFVSAVQPSNQTSVQITGLVAGQEYVYEANAIVADGSVEATSNSVTFTT